MTALTAPPPTRVVGTRPAAPTSPTGPTGPTGPARPSRQVAVRGHAPTPAAPSTTVAVLGGDALGRDGVSALLEGVRGLALAGDGEDAATDVVVLVEQEVRSADLRTRADQRRRSGPGAAVVLVTGHLADADVVAALDAGVMAVLDRRTVDTARLAAAVRTVAGGGAVLPPRTQAALVHRLRQVRTEVLEPNGLTLSGLSARETEVLRLLAEGAGTEAVAQRLSYSPRTVKYVLTGVMTRLGLRSRAHAVALAVRTGAI